MSHSEREGKRGGVGRVEVDERSEQEGACVVVAMPLEGRRTWEVMGGGVRAGISANGSVTARVVS